jgi:hypothetical protein
MSTVDYMQSETKNFTPCFILVSYSMTESRGREENERLKENRVHLAMVTFAAINSLQSLSNSPPTDAMLVSPLYIFASLAMAAAVGVSAQDASPCVLDCANKAVAPSGCDGLYVLLAHYWAATTGPPSLMHSSFLATMLVCATTWPSSLQLPLVSRIIARQMTSKRPYNCIRRDAACSTHTRMCPLIPAFHSWGLELNLF